MKSENVDWREGNARRIIRAYHKWQISRTLWRSEGKETNKRDLAAKQMPKSIHIKDG